MRSSDQIARRLKLRDLRILLAVAKSGSMGKAAGELAVSQPVISKAISDLEHAVGVRLLDRSPRGIEPTIYGEALLNCGMAVLDDLQQGVKKLEFLADPTAGELRIGCTEPLAAGFVPTVIERLSGRYPRLVFHVVSADSTRLKNRELRQRNVDLAVAVAASSRLEDDLDAQLLFDDRFVVMVGATSQWTRRRKVALRELLNDAWILPPPDSVMGANVAAAFRAAGLEPPSPRVMSYSIPLHHHLVATGQFITMLPISMLRLGKHVPLKPIAVELPEIPRPIAIMKLKNRMLGPVAQLFIDTAREVAKPLAKRRA
jgi:DNA-binding transcriptional LysR family regulator